MAKLAKKHKDELDNLKRMVGDWETYFGSNISRYHSMRSFLFRSNLSDSDKQKLDELEKPAIQFNKVEAFVSRLIGEFSQQEPSLMVSASPITNTAPQLISVLNGYYKQMIDDTKKDGTETEIYKSQMSGGFDVVRVYTDYENETTFNQFIDFERCYDPTLCGFDPLARKPHKGDGQYCYEKYPKRISELKTMYADINWDEMKFSDNASWSYNDKDKDERVVMLVDLYKKKYKTQELVYLAGNKVMRAEDYQRILDNWMSIEQPPKVLKRRKAKITYVCRYVFVETEVLDYEETIFKQLPLIFFDGNSAYLREASFGTNGQQNVGEVKQFTRPYFYNAVDMQKLVNLSGQTIANKIESLVQSQFKIPVDGIPDEYIDNWINPQKASMLPYNARDEMGNELPIPAEVVNPPMPAEVVQSFAMADQNIQSILGAYDAALGIQGNVAPSGKAIIAGATNSNSAARPYIHNYLVSFGQLASVILDLIPKVLVTPATIPIITEDGKNEYVFINVDDPKGANFDFDPSHLNVIVKPGINFEVQKDKDLQTLTQLSQAYPGLAEFMNTEGLPFVFDNLSIKNSDLLKQKAQEFLANKKQMAAKNAMNNPEMMALQLKNKQLMMESQHKQHQLAIEDEKLKVSKYEAILKFIESNKDSFIRLMEAQNTAKKNALEASIAKEDQQHRHAKETLDTITAMAQASIDKAEKESKATEKSN